MKLKKKEFLALKQGRHTVTEYLYEFNHLARYAPAEVATDEAKQELGALIAACRREHVFCACVMHGHGKHILKQQTPLWLTV